MFPLAIFEYLDCKPIAVSKPQKFCSALKAWKTKSCLIMYRSHSKIKLQKGFGSIVSLPHQFRQNTMIWTIDLYGLGYALLAHPYFKKSLVWLFSVQMG